MLRMDIRFFLLTIPIVGAYVEDGHKVLLIAHIKVPFRGPRQRQRHSRPELGTSAL